MAWTHPLDCRSLRGHAEFQVPLDLQKFFCDHWLNGGTAMEQRFRNYSSDSVASDGVFIEDLHYQGMLRATDHRKGRVCPTWFPGCCFSVVLKSSVLLLWLFLIQFFKKNKCNGGLVRVCPCSSSATPLRVSSMFLFLLVNCARHPFGKDEQTKEKKYVSLLVRNSDLNRCKE